MKKLLGAVLVSTLVMVTGCNNSTAQADNHDADVKAIREDVARWKSDFDAKDLDKLVSHYTDDVISMAQGLPIATGREAARAVVKGLISDPVFSQPVLEVSRVEVAKSGDLAYVVARYQATMTDPVSKKPFNDRGSVVEVYRKQNDGSWKSAADIATSEVPPNQIAAQSK